MYSNFFCTPRFSSSSGRMPPRKSSLVRIVAFDKRLFDLCDAAGVRHLRRRIDLGDLAVCSRHAIPHARRGRDQVEIKLAFEPFLHDLHVQQAEKIRSESRNPRAVDDSGSKKNDASFKPQLFHRIAKVFVLRRIDRVKPRENHRLYFLKAGKWSFHRAEPHSVIVSPICTSATVLIDAVRKPTSPGPSSFIGVGRGRFTPNRFNQILTSGIEKLDLRALLDPCRR